MPVIKFPGRPSRVQNPTEPPEPPTDMDTRVTKLEALTEKTGDRLTAIERDVAVLRANYATKEDLHKEIAASTRWFVGWVAAVYFIARTVH